MFRSLTSLILTVAALFWLQLTPSAAEDNDVLAAARATITAQIDAFKRDDGVTAFSFAAPLIQQSFPTPDAFMAMVKGGYQPVYRPRSYAFQKGEASGDGTFKQALDILGPDGNYWVAEYSLATMPDGTLKITGCRLIKRDGVGA